VITQQTNLLSLGMFVKQLTALWIICSSTLLMAQNYETQKFELIKTLDEVEIRYYPPVIKIASVQENGFKNLFGFISGNNSSQQKIAMTTPVYMADNKGKKVMEFVLPSSFDLENTPLPNSKEVEVYQAQSAYVIAYGYGGYSNANKTAKAIDKLRQTAQKNGLKIIGAPQLLVYNAPYQFWSRKNEVLLEIAY